MKHKNNVKCIVAMAVIMIISLCACSSDKDNVWTTEVSSMLYSQQDISDAIDVVKSDFKQNNSGFTLKNYTMPGMRQASLIRNGQTEIKRMKYWYCCQHFTQIVMVDQINHLNLIQNTRIGTGYWSEMMAANGR